MRRKLINYHNISTVLVVNKIRTHSTKLNIIVLHGYRCFWIDKKQKKKNESENVFFQENWKNSFHFAD